MFSPSPFPGWAMRLLTGNPDRDSEHRLLLNCIGRLRELCDHLEHGENSVAETGVKASRDELMDLLGDLLALLVDHFYAEEKLMRHFGLADSAKALCDRHKEEHAQISDTVLGIVCMLDHTQIRPLVARLRTVLDDWVEGHIRVHDAALVELIGKP